MAKKLTPEEIAQLPLTPADRMRLATHYGHEGDALAVAMAAPWTGTPTAPAGSALAKSTAQFAAYSPKATTKPLGDDVRLLHAPGFEEKPLTEDEVAYTKNPSRLTADEIAYIKDPSAKPAGAPAWFHQKDPPSMVIVPKTAPGEVEDLGGDERAATAAEKAKDAAKAKAMGYATPYAPAATPGNPYAEDPTEKMKAEFFQVTGMGKPKKSW